MKRDFDEIRAVAGAKAGSEAAWRRLVEIHQLGLVRLAWRMTGDAELALELAQATFVEAFLHIGQLRKDGAFGAWVRTILIRQVRRSRKRSVSLQDCHPTHRRTPQVEMSASELRQAADRAIAALEPIYREALALAMEGGVTSTEAAEMLNCSPEAYRFRVHKARAKLRKMLARFLED